MRRAYRGCPSPSPRPLPWWSRAGWLLVILLVAPASSAQDVTARLPLDPAVHTGQLANGLTYFIRRNTRPEHRAVLRLAVKAGSIDESEQQRGLAHFLEHMAFNGTAHFKAGELVKYLESIGARFGPDVNAYTSYDETVYMLDVPTDREGLLDQGFLALSDFAGGMTLDAAEIDRERGVIIEEWRQRQGAGSRIQSVQTGVLYGHSRYAERLPIGTPEILKSFPPERLRAFYRDHYLPDRMAVIVVGDFDPATAEKLIRQHFDGLAKHKSHDRRVYPVPSHRDTRYASTSDTEAQASSVTIVNKRPLEPLRSAADYRRTLVESVVQQMFDGRLGEIARRPDAPFLAASTGRDTLGRTVESFTLSARVNDGGIERGLAALTEEMARIRQYGFGPAELDRVKKEVLAGYERSYNERDKSDSGAFAFELLRYFLEGEATPGMQAEFDLARRIIPAITADETTARARELLADGNRVVLAVAPKKDGLTPVTESALRDAEHRGTTASVEAWHDEAVGQELMATLPTPGTVRTSRAIPELGVTVLTLSNGVDVWLKPTDFKNDQVLFSAYARGGTSLASEQDYRNASLSSTFVAVAGVGGFTPVELGKMLAGKIVNVSSYVSTYTHGISGGSTPRDLETALQLVHLNFTDPNRTPEAFALLKRRLQAAIANQSESPGRAFTERMRQINTMDNYTMRPIHAEDIDRLNPDRMAAYYAERFGNAADFTFFFVGAFTVEQITPLLTTYLASLPSHGPHADTLGDVHLQFPAAVLHETVRKGREPQSRTVISFFADTGLDEMEMHRVRAATTILETHLRDILREELGGTYSVSVDYSNAQPQQGYGMTTVEFGSAPGNADKLVSAVMTEVQRLQRDGPTIDDVKHVEEGEKRELETADRQNGYWLGSLETVHLLGWDPRQIAHRRERTESLTPDNIHEALRKYFPDTRYTVVTLLPEEGTH